ncbi:MAG TPA: NlpC/P60 family protein [Deltaproteobacteria bacterium]|nr:NlpC/P60 family protein [Deltaproteobacteria bacterium]
MRIPFWLVILILSILLPGCAQWKTVQPYHGKYGYQPHKTAPTVKRMGFSIQVGAFSKVENAIRLTKSLEGQGLNAFYFAHKSGLYKVRFGNYASMAKASIEAERLQQQGVISGFYIVMPSDYPIAGDGVTALGGYEIRDGIVSTARTFIGLPYQWGSCTIGGPVDCSGLVMAVYQLNGLNVPRTSEEQFQYGIPVDKGDLQKGDLVFFSTNGDGRVSHVGIYIGEGRFIHAPGTGKTICTDSLSRTYFSERFIGACTYLR